MTGLPDTRDASLRIAVVGLVASCALGFIIGSSRSSLAQLPVFLMCIVALVMTPVISRRLPRPKRWTAFIGVAAYVLFVCIPAIQATASGFALTPGGRSFVGLLWPATVALLSLVAWLFGSVVRLPWLRHRQFNSSLAATGLSVRSIEFRLACLAIMGCLVGATATWAYVRSLPASVRPDVAGEAQLVISQLRGRGSGSQLALALAGAASTPILGLGLVLSWRRAGWASSRWLVVLLATTSVFAVAGLTFLGSRQRVVVPVLAAVLLYVSTRGRGAGTSIPKRSRRLVVLTVAIAAFVAWSSLVGMSRSSGFYGAEDWRRSSAVVVDLFAPTVPLIQETDAVGPLLGSTYLSDIETVLGTSPPGAGRSASDLIGRAVGASYGVSTLNYAEGYANFMLPGALIIAFGFAMGIRSLLSVAVYSASAGRVVMATVIAAIMVQLYTRSSLITQAAGQLGLVLVGVSYAVALRRAQSPAVLRSAGVALP